MTRALAPLQDLAERLEIAIVGVHHLRKSQGGKPDLRGSSALKAAADSVIMVQREGGLKDPRRKITVESRYGMAEFVGELVDGCYRLVDPDEIADEKRQKRKEKQERTRALNREKEIEKARACLARHPDGVDTQTAYAETEIPMKRIPEIFDVVGHREPGRGNQPNRWLPLDSE